LLDLATAREAVGNDDNVCRGVSQLRKEAVLGDGDRDVVVLAYRFFNLWLPLIPALAGRRHIQRHA
jgi:hypothetical protein